MVYDRKDRRGNVCFERVRALGADAYLSSFGRYARASHRYGAGRRGHRRTGESVDELARYRRFDARPLGSYRRLEILSRFRHARSGRKVAAQKIPLVARGGEGKSAERGVWIFPKISLRKNIEYFKALLPDF